MFTFFSHNVRCLFHATPIQTSEQKVSRIKTFDLISFFGKRGEEINAFLNVHLNIWKWKLLRFRIYVGDGRVIRFHSFICFNVSRYLTLIMKAFMEFYFTKLSTKMEMNQRFMEIAHTRYTTKRYIWVEMAEKKENNFNCDLYPERFFGNGNRSKWSKWKPSCGFISHLAPN